jgi:hypothetical protein
MFLLVERIGGLQNIRMAGLAAVLAYADLIDASSHYQKPAFDCWWEPDESILRSHNMLRSKAGNAPGKAFFAKIPGGLPPKMLSVLVRLATIDRYMADRRGKDLDKDEENHMMQTRNAIQHTMLALPAFSDLSEDDSSGAHPMMYELCRLTAVIYSGAVIMGVPPHLGWHTALVKRLRKMLEACKMDECKDEESDLLVWSLCVGGLAAWRSSHRAFFETSLKEVARRRKLSNWQKVERILEDFLWSEAACKHGAAMLWLSL